MKADLVMDFIWGSAGKGGVAGHMALRRPYDAVVCAYGTQAGHTYNNAAAGIRMMVQQLPVGIISPTVKRVFIGPGALIHADVLRSELEKYGHHLEGKRLMIHEHAAVVEDRHSKEEYAAGYTKIGSTAKGVGRAAIERIERNPENPNCARRRWAGTDLEQYIVDRFEYDREMSRVDYLLIEGAQGFSLSVYHGDYPYSTSRDVTPWQIAADCALPWAMTANIAVYGVVRTYPIRVNNRDGSSGPAYEGQRELDWEEIGQKPELTTVTKRPRRVFDFSMWQLEHAVWHCADGHQSAVVLSFADYCQTFDELAAIIDQIERVQPLDALVFGPDDADVLWTAGMPWGTKMHAIRHRWEQVTGRSSCAAE
jgi:adenylosuccinate synthase